MKAKRRNRSPIARFDWVLTLQKTEQYSMPDGNFMNTPSLMLGPIGESH